MAGASVYCISRGSSRIPAVMPDTRVRPSAAPSACLFRPSTPLLSFALKTWMPATSTGMTRIGKTVTDFVYEITCSGGQAQEDVVQTWADRDAAPLWTALPGLSAVDLYRPVRG